MMSNRLKKVEHDGIEFKFFETKLGADTAELAKTLTAFACLSTMT